MQTGHKASFFLVFLVDGLCIGWKVTLGANLIHLKFGPAAVLGSMAQAFAMLLDASGTWKPRKIQQANVFAKQVTMKATRALSAWRGEAGEGA